jgi:hypothetical protein
MISKAAKKMSKTCIKRFLRRRVGSGGETNGAPVLGMLPAFGETATVG